MRHKFLKQDTLYLALMLGIVVWIVWLVAAISNPQKSPGTQITTRAWDEVTPSPITPTVVTPTPVSCNPVYPGSYWNKKVSELGLGIHPRNSDYINELLTPNRPLGSAPGAYTYPIYNTSSKVRPVTVRMSGWYSNVVAPGDLRLSQAPTLSIRIPPNAQPVSGSDSHLLVVDFATGDEWGFWHASKQPDGTWNAENGYHYNIKWNSEVPQGFGARGAGIPYMAGLIRKCEVDAGEIRHAIAFGYTFPCGPRATGTCRSNSPEFVYPAIKSDGKADEAWALPEGARLYISPPASNTERNAWCGTNSTCLIMLKALETYGMIVVDNAGSSKLYPESSLTANWGTQLTQQTPSQIPISRFKVLDFIQR